jgi:hypothetical protein
MKIRSSADAFFNAESFASFTSGITDPCNPKLLAFFASSEAARALGSFA